MAKDKKNEPQAENKSSIVMYQSEDGRTKLQVHFQDETVWLTQKLMAELFQITVPTLNEHIKNIYKEGELVAGATIRKFRIVQKEGSRSVSRDVEFYNLDMILSVGYRVSSLRGTQFRIWATEHLKEYIVKGFVMNDERLKQVTSEGSDYFDELLARIRDIRASEKRFYQKIRDIYRLAVDYDPKAEKTQEFFSIVQNKLHFAISGKTAAEIIAQRSDVSKPNMGLTTWKGSRVRPVDVTIAKNYLNKEELDALDRIVSMYLDFAESQAKRHKQIFMKDWREKLDAFLKLNERDILKSAGKISKELADKLALEKYEVFNANRLKLEAESEVIADDNRLKEIEEKGLKLRLLKGKKLHGRKKNIK